TSGDSCFPIRRSHLLHHPDVRNWLLASGPSGSIDHGNFRFGGAKELGRRHSHFPIRMGTAAGRIRHFGASPLWSGDTHLVTTRIPGGLSFVSFSELMPVSHRFGIAVDPNFNSKNTFSK